MPRLALPGHPLLVILFGHRREAHLPVQLVGREQDVLEDGRALFGARNFNQDAERQGVVDHRLTNVENVHAALCQDAGDSRSETRTVLTGDVYQDNFAQGAPPQWKKTAFYSLSVTAGHRERFAATGSLAILRGNFSERAVLCEPAHARQN